MLLFLVLWCSVLLIVHLSKPVCSPQVITATWTSDQVVTRDFGEHPCPGVFFLHPQVYRAVWGSSSQNSPWRPQKAGGTSLFTHREQGKVFPLVSLSPFWMEGPFFMKHTAWRLVKQSYLDEETSHLFRKTLFYFFLLINCVGGYICWERQ